MNTFDVASCASWLNGRAAASFGAALILEDLADCVFGVLRVFQIADNNQL